MNKIQIALIGVGHLGSRHLKVLSSLRNKIDIVGVCDADGEQPRKVAKKFKAPFFDNYRIFAGKIDAVIICTPTSLHYEMGKFFLEKKIHTFIEKPITPTVAEAEELIKIAQQNSLKLQVGHVERFNSAFTAVSSLAKEPHFIECHRLNHFPNRSLDIGVVMDLMIHDIDIVLGLIHSKIKEIRAVGAPILTQKEDIANVRIEFENGCVCNLTSSRVSDEVMRKIRMFLKDTYVSLDYQKQHAKLFTKVNNRITKKSLPIEREEPLKREIESFIDCIENDKRPIVSGVEAKNALEVALEITKLIGDNPLKI